jgi:hypothetical protein
MTAFEHDDDHSPARGVLLGVLLGGVLWAVIVALALLGGMV